MFAKRTPHNWPFLFNINSKLNPEVTSSRKGKYGWCYTDLSNFKIYGLCSYSCTFGTGSSPYQYLNIAKFKQANCTLDKNIIYLHFMPNM